MGRRGKDDDAATVGVKSKAKTHERTEGMGKWGTRRKRKGRGGIREKRGWGGEEAEWRDRRDGAGASRLVVAATEADDVAAARALEGGLRRDDVDVESVEAEGLEQVLGLRVDVDGDALVVEGRDIRDVVVLALALLLLELERDTRNRATLDALHQVRREAGNLVAQALRRDDGNLVADLLVDMAVRAGSEVSREVCLLTGGCVRTSQGSTEGSTSR